MATELSTQSNAAMIENVVIGGDLSKLSPEQRVSYYMQVCKSLGLNPLTKPFDYINLNGRLTLYARKDATDQIRQINGISIDKPDIQYVDDWIVVTVAARNDQGRTDSDVGVVKKTDMRGDFGNALMKAVTKAKRRVTLSICGLGMLDETEVETIPEVKPVTVTDTGEVIEGKATETKPDITQALAHLAGITTSKGESYLMLDNETLSGHSIGIAKALRENHLTEEKRAEYERKQAAIGEILAYRNGAQA